MKKSLTKNRINGFTLIELLVSIFIIGVIASVTVYNHREFTDSLEITNLAYAMALSIREAQISGTSVRSGTTLGNFDKAYGVHFNVSSDSSFQGLNNSYIIFVDEDGDQTYGTLAPLSYAGFQGCGNTGVNPECVQKIDIGRGNVISNICARDGVNLYCVESSNIRSVDLTFLRPKLDTNIRFRDSNGQSYLSNQFNDKEVIICLKSPLGRVKSINILHTGQVSVTKDDACQ